MEQLNEYLQQLISVSGRELRLEPNKNPYVVTSGGQTEVANAPLPGSSINMMIFSLIPDEVKRQLPSSQEVRFVHPHNLGEFSFLVRKSPGGFNVTVSPLNELPSFEDAAPAAAVQETAPPAPAQPPASGLPELEFNSFAPSQDPGPAESQEEEFETVMADGIVIEPGYDIPASEPAAYTPEPVVEVTPPPAPVETYVEPEIPQTKPPVQPVIEQTPEPTPAPVPQPAPTVMEPVQQQYQAPVEPPRANVEAPQAPPAAEAAPLRAAQPNPQARAQMDELFRKMAAEGSSDLHMSVSVPPMIRKDGRMRELEAGMPVLTPESMRDLLTSIMPDKNYEEFERRSDTDFAYEIPGLARFRANIFMDRKGMGGVFRIIPSDIMTAEDLKLSKHILDLCDLSKGLVVVTGPTGSGKSTTLCAMVDYINKRREDHIITIEDPIEFTHENQKCLVNQREVHNHTDSFKDALRAALREDPDIVLVGEMRDLETISIAIETAETGHLVFGTLHTTTAASTVDRIIDQFPADRQQQIRVMLSESLRGVIAQTLLPKKGGGRIAALEVLIVTPAISNLIREGKTFQIPSAMQTGKNHGMVMLNDALMSLVSQGIVEPRDAYVKAVDKTGFEILLQRNGASL